MTRLSKALKHLLKLPSEIWLMIISYLPGRIGITLRYMFWKNRLKYLGQNVIIEPNVYFQNPEYISLDDDSWIDRNVIILAGQPREGRITHVKNAPDFPLDIGEVYIGKRTHIATNCILSGMGGLYIGCNSGVAANSSIYSYSHHYRNLNNREDTYQYSFAPMARLDQQSMILGSVFIDDYSGIGLHSIILPGTSLKKGCFVASGSIISGQFPDQTLIYTLGEIHTKSLSHLYIKE